MTDGTEWLAVRPDAKFDGSKPISGGLPICWPQFGNGDIQQHGFARNLPWRLLEEPTDAGSCVLELADTEETREMWPHNFRVEYRIDLKEDRLSTTFTVENTSNSAFDFTGALHSYYNVFNVDACSICGDFKGATILDKTQDPVAIGTSGSETVKIVKPTETIYKEVLPGNYSIEDPSKGTLVVENEGGWRDVMVWNPYGEEKMGYDGFVCAESVATAPQRVAPNGTWVAKMDLVPKPLA